MSVLHYRPGAGVLQTTFDAGYHVRRFLSIPFLGHFTFFQGRRFLSLRRALYCVLQVIPAGFRAQ